MTSQRSPSKRARAGGSKAAAARSPSQRQLRVGEELRHALARILGRGELHDPVLAGASVTVTEVRISPDLKNATAFVMPLGGRDAAAILTALNRAAPFLRGQLGGEVRLRYTPRLSFQPDHSFDEAAKINALLHQPRVLRGVQEPAAGADGAEQDPARPSSGGGGPEQGGRDDASGDGR